MALVSKVIPVPPVPRGRNSIKPNSFAQVTGGNGRTEIHFHFHGEALDLYRFLPRQEAAKFIGMEAQTLDKARKEGHIAPVVHGTKVTYQVMELLRYQALYIEAIA